MKKILSTLGICISLLASTVITKGQALTPQPSSGQTIIQDFGLGKVTISYSRPNMKGRKIFGGLEPYGKVWRTGANSATSITFTDDVMMAGKKVPAGKYALFTIPGEKEWTIIMNKNIDQWGAYDYKEADDLFRFNLFPVKSEETIETFTMQFNDVKPGSMELYLAWENTTLSIPLTVDYDAKVMANIESAMKSDKKPYFAAAQYYFENDKDLNQALKWVTKAEEADQKAPWYKLWKAKIQLKMGDKKGAMETATKGMNLAKEANNEEYVRLNSEVIATAKR